ncbi:hypothetical protein [Vulcanisaeta distributa]|uniref:hypothetical protein n=1 Tax=Vulcanisaeta distributa TaxID=164451 RepID=UPI000AC3DACA|nr:hypothetical protein [Vulcanisaeta distributa]
MIRVIPSNKLLVIYITLSGITYIGLLTNNLFGTYFGIMLFLVFTSYVLSWYLLAILMALYSQLIFSQGSAELTVGSSATIGVRVSSRLPIRWDAELTLVHSPHILSDTLRIKVNDGDYLVKLVGRWIGSTRIVGGIMEFKEPLGGLLVIQRLLLRNVDVIIKPRQVTGSIGKTGGVGGYIEYGLSLEGRLGDLRSLLIYDYERPASSIHWITSARVNELMMINRSDYGSCPIFIVSASSRMLIPRNGKRPIDDALQMISDSVQYCGEVKVVLIRRGYIEEKVVSRGAIPYLEREVRISVIKNYHGSNVSVDIPTYFRKYISEDDLSDIAT